MAERGRGRGAAADSEGNPRRWEAKGQGEPGSKRRKGGRPHWDKGREQGWKEDAERWDG